MASTTLNVGGCLGSAASGAGAFGLAPAAGRRGFDAGFSSAFSSGTIWAPVPFVSVSSTHVLRIELTKDNRRTLSSNGSMRSGKTGAGKAYVKRRVGGVVRDELGEVLSVDPRDQTA